LTHLNLEGNNIGDNGGRELIKSLSSLNGLKELVLSDNALQTNSGHALFEYFEAGNNIERMELHYNNFNGFDLTEFTQNMHKYSNLRVLDMSWNSIGSSSLCIKSLADSLSQNNSL